MKSIIQKTDIGIAMHLSIKPEEVFTEEFRQYAKMTMIGRAAQISQFQKIDGEPKDSPKIFDASTETLNIVSKELCDCCANAVMAIICDLGKRIRDGEYDEEITELYDALKAGEDEKEK